MYRGFNYINFLESIYDSNVEVSTEDKKAYSYYKIIRRAAEDGNVQCIGCINFRNQYEFGTYENICESYMNISQEDCQRHLNNCLSGFNIRGFYEEQLLIQLLELATVVETG